MKQMKHTIFQILLLCMSITALQSCNSSRKSAQNSSAQGKEFNLVQLAESNNRFALDLFKQVNPGRENIIYSPYSISNILALVYGGTREQTAAEMAEVLYFPQNHQDLHGAEKKLGESLDSVNFSPGTEMEIANAIWAQENFTFLPGYFELAGKFYGAPLELVDFIPEDRREKSRIQINEWVSGNTRQHIRDLIPPGLLNTNTRMVLTNAIYFNGKWEYPFTKDSTLPSVFHVSREESLNTMFMSQTKTFPYYEDEEVQALSLPYKGERMSMLIILPKNTEGWKIVSRVLDPERLQIVISNMQSEKVRVAIPRFKTEMNLNLRKELVTMGMEEAFSRNADLSGMTGEKNLFISEVIHKAYIEVTEAGTEAAAATAAIVGLKAALEEGPKQFRADHPFIYFLRDDKTGCIIFAGRLVRPSEII